MNLLLKRIRSIYAYYERKQAQKQDGFSVVFLYFPNWIKKESRPSSGETQKQRKLQHEPHGDGLAQYAVLEPAADLADIRQVFVIKDFSIVE